MEQSDINEMVIQKFRTGSEIQGMHRERLLLLTTTGAKTRRPRTAPMMFHREGERLFVVASNNGADADPQWYVNLREHPRVTVESPDAVFEAVASTVTGEERERVWSRLLETAPFFADHQANVTRRIPLVELVAATT